MLRTVKGCVGKDPDAQGSGSEKRDLLRSRQSNTGWGQNQVKSRGDLESASTQIKV